MSADMASIVSPSTLPSLTSSTLLLRPAIPKLPFYTTAIPLQSHRRRTSVVLVAAATKKNEEVPVQKNKTEEAEEVDVEEDLPWIQEKALDLVEFTGSVTQAIPGPRVGHSSLPWILAVPLAYAGITFVIAFVKIVRRLNSPRQKRKRLVSKNAFLCKSIDELLQKDAGVIEHSALMGLAKETDFSMEEILRKYLRYVLNEKPFNPLFVANLIQLRKASMLDDSQIAEILNEISRRVVQEKGPVVMNRSGYTEKGFKRKLAVQALFGKVFYLSQLPEFCSEDKSLIIKQIFGVTDDDADKLRLHTLSDSGDMDSLEKMVDASDSEDSKSS